LAVLGTANIARKNIRAIGEAAGIVVTAVGSRNPEKAKTYCQEVALPPSTICCSYKEALANPDIDAVYLPLPTALHLEWVSLAAAAGKHILCEKPVAVDPAELKTIESAASSVVLMDGVMFMHNERLSSIRSSLQGGRVGKAGARHVSSCFTFRGSASFFAENIRVKKAGDPLGCLGDLGWYNIRVSLAAFDWAMPSRASGTIASQTDEGVPLSMSASLRWDDGRTATFTCSFTHALQQWCRIAGDDAVIAMDDFVIPHHPTTSKFKIVSEDFAEEAAFCRRHEEEVVIEGGKPQEVLMWEAFAARVQEAKTSGEVPKPSLTYEAMTQLVTDAVLRSARSGGAEVDVAQAL
jgi:predicted dehydrogenase